MTHCKIWLCTCFSLVHRAAPDLLVMGTSGLFYPIAMVSNKQNCRGIRQVKKTGRKTVNSSKLQKFQKAWNVLWSWGHAMCPNEMGMVAGEKSLPVCFSKIHLCHQLAEKASTVLWINIYMSILYLNHRVCLAYVSRLQEFTTFSLGVWCWLKELNLLPSHSLIFL